MKPRTANVPQDDGLEVLRGVYEKKKPGIPWSLVEACYLIERRHPYESDRDITISEIKNAINHYVSNKLDAAD